MVRFAKSILNAHKIENVILREQLAGVVWCIGLIDVWSELWIQDNENFDETLQLIESSMVQSEMWVNSWKFHFCGEEIEFQYKQCWKCDTE